MTWELGSSAKNLSEDTAGIQVVVVAESGPQEGSQKECRAKPTETSCTIKGLLPNTKYSVQVSPFSEDLDVEWHESHDLPKSEGTVTRVITWPGGKFFLLCLCI